MRRPLARLAWLAVAIVAAAAALLVAVSWLHARSFHVSALATRAPERTALMRQREREAAAHGKTFRVDRRWVPYQRIAPILRRAVLVAEDDAFFAHGGLDWHELEASARENMRRRRVVRGGSTITQQLARNLFLGDARTPTRKLTELFLALRIERALTKRRILELYLNSIEWGDGIFGIEAAARRHFHVSAAELNPRQAVLLASVIINPRRHDAADPGRRILRRARIIAGRLHRRGHLSDAAYRIAIGLPPPDSSASAGPADSVRGTVTTPETTSAPGDTTAPAPIDSTVDGG